MVFQNTEGDSFKKSEDIPIGSMQKRNIIRHRAGVDSPEEDWLAVEEPLEIRLDFEAKGERRQKSISITMRTPGHDEDLALGFLFTEGLVKAPTDIEHIGHCGPALPHLGHSNVIKVRLRNSASLDLSRLERHFYTSSSCGVCGKASIDALRSQSHFPLPANDFRIAESLLHILPELQRCEQEIFATTGGLHASTIFNSQGKILVQREDVGRHNALDKALGSLLGCQGQTSLLPLHESILLVSGRLSFELVQKAAMARIPIVLAVGAPSSLAVELAETESMTLVGFLRDGRYNIYSGAQRIQTSSKGS